MFQLESGLEFVREGIAPVFFKISQIPQVFIGFSDLNEKCVGQNGFNGIHFSTVFTPNSRLAVTINYVVYTSCQ
jgi:hypothetical protein